MKVVEMVILSRHVTFVTNNAIIIISLIRQLMSPIENAKGHYISYKYIHLR